MSREDAEAIVREVFADEYMVDYMVQDIVDRAYDEPKREYIAHALWADGAGVEHDGCPYGPPEPADADYENTCDVCQAHVLTIADRILAEVTESTGPGQ